MRVQGRSVQRFIRIASIALLTWAPLSLGLSIGSVLFSTPAAAQVESVAVEFRTGLEPYGSFRRVARWGEVWVPNVAADWRPYSVGRWIYSEDYGWYWVSDAPEAPWGWVVFHYGRWVWIDDIGWAWVPGREWGPAWVDWRRGGRYIGWAPLPPEDLIVDIRDEPQYWIFCRPTDFLAADIARIFIEPEPVLLRETVVVNETVVVRDRGFAVNPGIEPAYIAGFIGRPIPEYQVRPHVLAGTASVPNAIEVTDEDLRRGDFRQDLVRQTNIRETNNAIEPARKVPPPQPLGPNEHGRLGENPPRAGSGFAQQPPRQPGAIGQAPEQQRGVNERGWRQRGATGAPGQQRNLQRGMLGPTRPERQRGLTERGANPGQERRLYNRGETGLPSGEQRGQTERGTFGTAPEQQRNFRERGAASPTAERGLNQRGAIPQQQRGLTERGANEPAPGPERPLFNRGETGLPPAQQRGPGERGPLGATPEQQRGLRERGIGGPAVEQRGRFGPQSGGLAPRERGATGSTAGEERQLFNRAPSRPGPGLQRGAGQRGPNGPAPGPGGGGQRHGFER